MIEQVRAVLEENKVSFESLEDVTPSGSDVPVFQMRSRGSFLNVWQRPKSLSPEMGFWPVYLSESIIPELVENSLAEVEQKIQAASQISLPNFEQRSLEEFNKSLLPASSLDKPESLYHPELVQRKWERQKAELEFFNRTLDQIFSIQLIPGKNSWSALAHCKIFYGNGYFDERVDQLTWARRWEELYGAQLFMTEGGLSFYVQHPPQTGQQAFHLCTELIESNFGIDVLVMELINERNYAAFLRDNPYWEFFWD